MRLTPKVVRFELAPVVETLRKGQQPQGWPMATPSTPTPATSTIAAPAIGGTAGGIVAELLTTKQAAELLAVGERTLWRWSRCGLAPAPVKIGLGPRASVRFRRAELMTWLAAGCPRVNGNGRAAG